MKRTFKNKAAIKCASLLVFILFIGIGFSFHTQKAEAVWVPTYDNQNHIQNTLTAVNTSSLIQKEVVADGILYAAMKIVISNITDSIVTWINSGFQGNPAFIANPEAFFLNVGDQVAGNFIASVADGDLSFLCEPFKFDIQFSLHLNYSSGSERQLGCTLSDILNNVENFADFTEGNFAQGGWSGWLQISQHPQNNTFGAYIKAENQLSQKIQNAVEEELTKSNWGKGFLSFTDDLGNIATPGAVIEGQLANVLGSGVRQLELADEINEIVGALIGQLVNQVLVGGLSSTGGVSEADPGEINGLCQANKNSADIGEPVRWTASVYGGSGPITYQWFGNIPLVGSTGNPVNLTYATDGVKTGRVRITRGGESKMVECVTSVSVTP